METPRPTIDLKSPYNHLVQKVRKNQLRNRVPKYDKKDYQKMYRIVNKHRRKQEQRIKLCDVIEDMEDPDPYSPWYVFYCFQGEWED